MLSIQGIYEHNFYTSEMEGNTTSESRVDEVARHSLGIIFGNPR